MTATRSRPTKRTEGARPRRRKGPKVDRRRLAWIDVSVVAVLVLIVWKLFTVQVASPEQFTALGRVQRMQEVHTPAQRGQIIDRDDRPFAISRLHPTITATPNMIEDPSRHVRHLAPVLGIEEAELWQMLDSDRGWVLLAERASDDVADRVAALVAEHDLEQVHFSDEPGRHQPAGRAARNVIGVVDDDIHQGRFGLEALFDAELAGVPGVSIQEVDGSQRTIAIGEAQVISEAQRGQDLRTTLDRNLQVETERLLAEGVARTGALSGTAVISEVGSSRILAMAAMRRHSDGTITNDGGPMAVTELFEPGSVNKIVAISGALQEGLIAPQSPIHTPYELTVADYTFTDSWRHPDVTWPVSEILVKSSNVGTIKIAQRLGEARLESYLRDFGFGRKSGIGFENESTGILAAAEDWSGTSLGSIAIGQGVAVTAVQTLMAYNAIANDGWFVEARLAEELIAADGTVTPVPVPEGRRVVDAEVADQVTQMLVDVVDEGTGLEAAVPGYTVAGKTGTAWKPQPGGGYLDEQGELHYLTDFVGFFPAHDPQYSIIVVLDEPQNSIFASQTAAPLFADLARMVARTERVVPDRAEDVTTGDGRVELAPEWVIDPETSPDLDHSADGHSEAETATDAAGTADDPGSSGQSGGASAADEAGVDPEGATQ